jgi:hypothetical protein
MSSSSNITPTESRDDGAAQLLSIEGILAAGNMARLARIEKTPLQELKAADVFLLFVSKVPALQPFEFVWAIDGADIVSIDPKLFVRKLQTEYVNFTFSVAKEVYKLVQLKIMSDREIPEGQSPRLATNIIQQWIDYLPSENQFNSVPEVPNPSQALPNSSIQSHVFPNFANFPNHAQLFANQNQFPAFTNLSNPFQDYVNVPNHLQGGYNFPNPRQGNFKDPAVPSYLPSTGFTNVNVNESPMAPRILNNDFSVSLDRYTAADVGVAIASACGIFSNVNGERQWPQVTIDGNFILKSNPSRFIELLTIQVQNISAGQQVAACAWARNQVLAQVQRNPAAVDVEMLRLWTIMPQGFPIVQQLQENVNPNQFAFTNVGGQTSKNSKFVIGGPRLPFQNAGAVVAVNQNGSSALHSFPALSANLLQHQLGQMVAHATQLPQNQGQTAASAAQFPYSSPMVASAAQMLNGATVASAAPMPHTQGQTAAYAAQFPSNFGQTVASAAQMPRSSATPLCSPMQTDASASLYSSIAFNPLIQQIVNTVRAQSRSSRPVMPWEALAMVSDPFVQDPGLPKGFKRLSVTKIVEAAKLKRAQTPAHVDMSKAVKYPIMSAFNGPEFFSTRKEYVAAIKASTISGMFNSFKSCLSVTAQNAALSVFRLTEERFIQIDDDVFMKWCALKFGPANKKEALKLLKSIKIYHSDNEHEQSEFVEKFDQVCYDFEMAVNDIVDSQDKWPFDPADIECSSLSLKDIMKEWKELFPKQEGARIFSVQLKKCRNFIDQNLELPFNEQVFKLRNYFADKDQEVANGEGIYSTYPRIRPKKTAYKNSSEGWKPRSDYAVSCNALTGGQTNKRERGPGGTPASKVANKIVAGSDRGKACGNLNNHMGLGCSKDTCPVFGTEYDKSRDRKHVWKSSDMEESVRLPNNMWNERLDANPKILENWKKARKERRNRKHQVKVSVLSTKDEDNESDDDAFGQEQVDKIEDEDEEEITSESDDDNEEVNSSLYSSEVCAMRVGVAAMSDPFCELGHEEQFFAVAKFAKNDEFIFKTLMDPGATINIICPEVANRAAIQRRQMAVSIFQGKRKQGSVEEMVQCAFELMGQDGKYATHVEWFAVCDLGYDVLLGRRFCRTKGFTSFDEKLRKFNDLPPLVGRLDVSAMEVSQQRVMLRFDRVVAPLGKARYKRKAKAVSAVANAEATCIGEFLLHAKSEEVLKGKRNVLSSLLLLDKKVQDDKNYVLLSFTVDTIDTKRSSKLEQWFQVVDGETLTLSVEDTSKIVASEAPIITRRKLTRAPKAEDKSKTQTPSVANLSDEEVLAKKRKISELAEKVRKENVIRFASYHPVKGYRLHRDAERPALSPHWKRDHKNYEASRDFRGERAQIKAAMETAEIAYMCGQKQRKLKAMVKELAKKEPAERGMSPGRIDCWLENLSHVKEISREVEVAAVEAEADGDVWVSEFKAGEYVEIMNAVVKPEFNGQRVRLFGKTRDDKTWIVRVLGKNGGKRRCNESLFKKLSTLEQQRSVPSGASAGFDEVGIDDAGQPNVEFKSLGHRQFGEEYSK